MSLVFRENAKNRQNHGVFGGLEAFLGCYFIQKMYIQLYYVPYSAMGQTLMIFFISKNFLSSSKSKKNRFCVIKSSGKFSHGIQLAENA